MTAYESTISRISGVVGRLRRSTRVRAVGCYVVEAAKMGVRVGADVASRMTVTLSHGPVSITLAPDTKANPPVNS